VTANGSNSFLLEEQKRRPDVSQTVYVSSSLKANGLYEDLERDPEKTQRFTGQDIQALIKDNEQHKWRVKDLENEIDDLKRQLDFKERSHETYKALMQQKLEELEAEKVDLLKKYQQKHGGSDADVNLSVQQEQQIQELKHKIQELELRSCQAPEGGVLALTNEKLEKQISDAKHRIEQKQRESEELDKQLKEAHKLAEEREMEC